MGNTGRMIDHFGINCADLQDSKSFYQAVLATLGHQQLVDYGVAVGYGTDAPRFWLSGAHPEVPQREMHVAFTATDKAAVDAFHAAALAAGAEELHAPRMWPEYHEHYYGSFVRDPDGNNVEAVCHSVQG